MSTRKDHVEGVIEAWRRERPDYDLRPVEIIGRMARIMQYLDRAIEARLGDFGVSRATFDALATLRRAGAPYRLSQRELMSALLRTSGSVSLRIDAAERAGLVVRESDPADRRTVLVGLTDAGKGLIDTVAPEHLRNEASQLAPLSEAERAELQRILAKWLAWFEAENGRDAPLLGMTVISARESLRRRRSVGLEDIAGILVDDADPGGSAAAAGIRRGDLITAVDGRSVESIHALRREFTVPDHRPRTVSIVRAVEVLEVVIR